MPLSNSRLRFKRQPWQWLCTNLLLPLGLSTALTVCFAYVTTTLVLSDPNLHEQILPFVHEHQFSEVITAQFIPLWNAYFLCYTLIEAMSIYFLSAFLIARLTRRGSIWPSAAMLLSLIFYPCYQTILALSNYLELSKPALESTSLIYASALFPACTHTLATALGFVTGLHFFKRKDTESN